MILTFFSVPHNILFFIFFHSFFSIFHLNFSSRFTLIFLFSSVQQYITHLKPQNFALKIIEKSSKIPLLYVQKSFVKITIYLFSLSSFQLPKTLKNINTILFLTSRSLLFLLLYSYTLFFVLYALLIQNYADFIYPRNKSITKNKLLL